MNIRSRVERIAKRIINPHREFPDSGEMEILRFLFVGYDAGDDEAIRIWQERFADDPSIFMDSARAQFRAGIQEQKRLRDEEWARRWGPQTERSDVHNSP